MFGIQGLTGEGLGFRGKWLGIGVLLGFVLVQWHVLLVEVLLEGGVGVEGLGMILGLGLVIVHL